MRIAFKAPTEPGEKWQTMEFNLAQAFAKSARGQGHEALVMEDIEDPSAFDMIAFMGVKNRKLLQKADDADVPYVYFDKGYNRDKRWWRMSYCAHNPTEYLMNLQRSADRRLAQGWWPKEWRLNPNGHIILAGSSAKYHELYGLPDPETYWEGVVAELGDFVSNKIIYRPKKSYGDARPLSGTEFSKTDIIEKEMRGAYAIITHGSNACFEAMLEGCPAIVLGNGITAPIVSEYLSDIEDLAYPDMDTRAKLLNDLAYFQWTAAEIEQGLHWSVLNDCKELRKAL